MAGTIFRTITTGDAVGFFKSAVQPFDELFERTELFGYLIVIRQADDLGDEDIPVFLQLELLRGQGIGAVAISNEFQGIAREFLKFLKSHAHGQDAGADIPGRRDLITEDGAGYFIHDEPDIGFHATDLDIGFISYKLVRGLVVIGIHEGADNDCGRFGIVIDHSMGDLNPMDLFEGLYSLPKGELEVHPGKRGTAP